MADIAYEDIQTGTQSLNYSIESQAEMHETETSFKNDITPPEIGYRSFYFFKEIPDYGRLKKELKVEIEYKEKVYWAKNEDLDINVFGDTAAEALNEFAEFVLEDYQNYKESKIEELHSSAKDLIKKYEEYL